MDVKTLSSIAMSPFSEVDANLRELDLSFFVASARRDLQHIVSPGDDVDRRAMQQLTPGDIENLASSIYVSWRCTASIDDIADQIMPPSAADAARRMQLGCAQCGVRELVMRYLLTIRELSSRESVDAVLRIKTGLSDSSLDVITSSTLSTLVLIADAIVTHAQRTRRPIFELRIPLDVLMHDATDHEYRLMPIMMHLLAGH